MLARAAAGWFGATDANAAALTVGLIPAGTSVRVGDLGGRGIMAPSTTVDAMMIVAMLATMLAATTGWPVTTPRPVMPATMTAPSRR
eukprot:7168506-Pyramimonas_sp.AAC.1